MKEKNKSMFVGLIGISLITFNLIVAAVILSPPLITQELYSYEIFVMDYPDNCSDNSTNPQVILPYYFYSDLPLNMKFCHLILQNEYGIGFKNPSNLFAYETFTATYFSYETRFRLPTLLEHGDLIVIELYDETNDSLGLLASAITTYVKLGENWI